MPALPDDLHLDRARAGSFGSAAEQYDRYRPSSPAALVDDLVALRPSSVLDVGCGTGKVAVALAARGLPVLGVEPDERMAEVARGHGIEVRIATFESWDGAGRTFDLITCGDAWHWIDPVRGGGRAADLLAAGGTLARFWTTSAVSAEVVAAFDPVYREFAPEVAQVWRSATSRPWLPDPVAGTGAFAPGERRTYPWERTVSADEWVGMAATISDHLRLGPARLGALLAALRQAITKLGGAVHVRHETAALFHRRR